MAVAVRMETLQVSPRGRCRLLLFPLLIPATTAPLSLRLLPGFLSLVKLQYLSTNGRVADEVLE